MLKLTMICVALSMSVGGCHRPDATMGEATGAMTEADAASEAPVAAAPSAQDEANQLYTMRCTPCHGAEGGGDGVAAAALNPHPQNYHDHAWQAATTDAQLENAIVNGGAAVGKSPSMPGNPDLSSRPLVVAALIAKIRAFGH